MSAPVALYVHLPLCVSLCPYCDFVVYAGRAARGPANRLAELVDALAAEIRMRGAAAPRREPLRSVYLGGGTPSLLTAEQVARLMGAAADAFGITPEAEVTIEVNPGADDSGDLAGFRAAGVNRVSVGAQSLAADELRRLGRRHSPDDVAATVAAARAAGFSSLSLDLLYDVPGQTLESWRRTLQSALALGPDHVSAYALTLDDPGAEGLSGPGGDHLPLQPGARRWRSRALFEQDQERAAAMYELADDLLAGAGLRWYEISNWARPGHASRHNQAYWRGQAWEAVGPGAHAFDGRRTRRWNAARLDAYLAALAAGRLPPGGSERTDQATAAAEAAILRLRTADGLPANAVRRGGLADALDWARANGMTEAGPREAVRLSRRGRLIADELFVRILPA